LSKSPFGAKPSTGEGGSDPRAVANAEKSKSASKGTDYKSTLQLPKTDFPMKANLPQREPATLKRWEESGLYQQILRAREGKPLWVLHDGPPYANGQVHIGTALNKILKDFVVRSRSMLGFKTPFVPGWDCHGMPIEHQVSLGLGSKARSMPKLDLRKLCRAHAEKFIEIQKRDFKRLGVIGDWANPYLTFSPEYDSAEIGVLRRLVEEGYVYRGLRPVHWCFDCRTALAEAEVEYRDHESPSIYVAFRFNDRLGDAGALAARREDRATLAAAHRDAELYALIWTTTPWTLPASLGICLNEGFDYVGLLSDNKCYIVAERLADEVAKACALKVEARIRLARDALRSLDGLDVLRHPFANRDVKLMFADHVTLDAGTGLVHTAPGHGYDDFVVGSRYGLTPLTPVDDGGVFTIEAGKYAGHRVFDANDQIVEDLRAVDALLHAENFAHNYPHCWRCRNPLIFRATDQWFLRIDHHGLRERALAEIDKVNWVPKWSRDRIRNMMETRPDWCLSRQRAWGVPIPALQCSGCAEVALAPIVMREVEKTFAREGSDSWYARPASDFTPTEYRCAKCGCGDFAKTEDILDVWFDSGCSHAAVLALSPQLKWPADLYVEGVDQHRGWFQMSLITATATLEDRPNAAPYRAVLTHGLTLDEIGRKMSKSMGNTEDAEDAVKRVGADLIRLVFASVDYSADMSVSENLFSSVSESYRKLRNTCRYMLGNLFDFDPAHDAVAHAELLEFDRFILLRTEIFKQRVYKAYEAYDFQAAYQALLNFAVVDLSSLYVDVVRDRLYCDGARSRERRSAQTALFEILDACVRMLAPLIPFTAEEIYSFMPDKKVASVHLLELQAPHPEWLNPDLEQKWTDLLVVRDEALRLLESMRQSGTIGASLEAGIDIIYSGEAMGRFAQTIKEQEKLFIVARVDSIPESQVVDNKYRVGGDFFKRPFAVGRPGFQMVGAIGGFPAPGVKCQRCWTYFDDGGDPELCPRCRAVVRA
jgi:isoleucyl-tRNA synthetase